MIRNRDTNQYYKGQGQWTSTVAEAIQFTDVAAAAAEAEKLGRQGNLEFVVEVNGQLAFSVRLGS